MTTLSRRDADDALKYGIDHGIKPVDLYRYMSA